MRSPIRTVLAFFHGAWACAAALTVLGCGIEVGGSSSISGIAPRTGSAGFDMIPAEAPPTRRFVPQELPSGAVVASVPPPPCEADLRPENETRDECPEHPPDSERCAVEGLDCLYPEQGGCFSRRECVLGVWTNTGQACPGPEPLVVPAAPSQGAVVVNTDRDASASASAEPGLLVPGLDASTRELDVEASDAGAAVALDPTAPGAPGSGAPGSGAQGSVTDSGSIDGARRLEIATVMVESPTLRSYQGLLDASASSGLALGEAMPLPVDAGASADGGAVQLANLPDCPLLAPVAGSLCEVHDGATCRYGGAPAVVSREMSCPCGRWYEVQPTSVASGALEGR
jgi:hypothetical protein